MWQRLDEVDFLRGSISALDRGQGEVLADILQDRNDCPLGVGPPMIQKISGDSQLAGEIRP